MPYGIARYWVNVGIDSVISDMTGVVTSYDVVMDGNGFPSDMHDGVARNGIGVRVQSGGADMAGVGPRYWVMVQINREVHRRNVAR